MIDIEDVSVEIKDGKVKTAPPGLILGKTLGEISQEALMAAIWAAKDGPTGGELLGSSPFPEVMVEDREED